MYPAIKKRLPPRVINNTPRQKLGSSFDKVNVLAIARALPLTGNEIAKLTPSAMIDVAITSRKSHLLRPIPGRRSIKNHLGLPTVTLESLPWDV